MAKHNIFDVILKTINDVQQKNEANPKEETAHPNVFDLLKGKLGELDQKVQNKRVNKGKKPVSILDMIKRQIQAARRENKKDPNTPTAPGSVFDRIIKKVEDKPQRAANTGLAKIVKDYNLDITRFSQDELRQMQVQYNNDLQAMHQKYAQAIHDASKRR